jgi:hypothetical protein
MEQSDFVFCELTGCEVIELSRSDEKLPLTAHPHSGQLSVPAGEFLRLGYNFVLGDHRQVVYHPQPRGPSHWLLTGL